VAATQVVDRAVPVHFSHQKFLLQHAQPGLDLIQLRFRHVVLLCQALEPPYLSLVVGDIGLDTLDLGEGIAQLQVQQVIIQHGDEVIFRHLLAHLGNPGKASAQLGGNFCIPLADHGAGQSQDRAAFVLRDRRQFHGSFLQRLLGQNDAAGAGRKEADE